ncbi:MAG: hypothetical protein ACKOC5_00440 [Chloroflexota bacterium]
MKGVCPTVSSLAHPLIGGLIFQVLGPSWPFRLGSLMLAVLLVYALRAIQPRRGELAPRGVARSAEH